MRGPTLLAIALVTMVSGALAAPAQAAPPVVDSGPDQMAPVGTGVVLQGSASDPDGDPLDIQWLQSVVADGDLSSCTFTGPISFEPISLAGLMPTLNCTQPGQYLFQLVAADGMDFEDSLGALVTFTENTPPTVDSGPDQTAPAGTDVMLQGSASDPDGQPLEIRWLRSVVADGDLSSCTFTGPTSFEPISPAGLMPTFNCSEPGQYLVQLVAGDGFEAVDDLGALVTFTELTNNPPIADSGPDQTAPVGTDVVLQGSASDPDGDALEIQWLFSVVADGDLSSCTFTGPTSFEPISPAGLMPTFNCSEPGQYLAQLVAADGMDFEDSLGALITFTEEPIDDITPPMCALGKITRRGASVIVADSESGVVSIRTRKRAWAIAWPWARRYDPPQPFVTVHVRRALPWIGGLVGIEAVNGQGLRSTCWVLLPVRRPPLVFNHPSGTD